MQRPWVFDPPPERMSVGQRCLHRLCHGVWPALRSRFWDKSLPVLGRRPLLNLALAGLTGTWLGFGQAWRGWSWPVGLLLAVIGRRWLRWQHAWLSLAVPLVFILTALRVWLLILPGETLARQQTGQTIPIEGQVLRLLSQAASQPTNDSGAAATDPVATALVRLDTGARLALTGPAAQLQPGSRIRAGGYANRPRPALNPGGFSESRWLNSLGVFLKLRVNDGQPIEIVRPAPAFSLARWGEQARTALYQASRSLVEPEQAALLCSLLLGDQERLTDLQVYQFRKAGLMHLTAVSGANVAFWLSPLSLLLRRLRLDRRLRQALLLSTLVAFGCLTGWQPSVSRAIIMAALVLIGRLLHRRSDPLNTLGLSVLVFLVGQPLALLGVSFWLTMAATAGLLILPEALGRRLARRWPWLPAWLVETAAVSIGVQAAVLPLTSWLGGEISLVSLAANLPALPLAEWLTLYGALCLPLVLAARWLTRWPALSGLLPPELFWTLAGRPLQGALVWLEQLAEWFAGCPVGRLPLAWLNLPLTLALAILLLRLVRPPARRSARQRLGQLGGLLLVTGLLTAVIQAAVQRSDQVWLLAVGQGDALLLRTRSGRTVLIDGGKPGMGWSVILPALDALGIGQIDLAIATHAHQDHAAGLAEVTATGRVRQLALAAGDSGDYHTLLTRLAAARGMPVQILQKHDTIQLNGTDCLAVLGTDQPPAADDANEQALHFLLTLQGRRILLLSDMTAGTEKALLAAGQPGEADVLKVAHHGSGQTTLWSFLQIVQPQAALISVGANQYGHPAKTLLDRLDRMNCPAWRTDRLGAIRLQIRRGQIRITSQTGNRPDD